MIKFKGTDDSISSNKESTDSPWCSMVKTISEIPSLDIHNQIRLSSVTSHVTMDMILGNIFIQLTSIMRLAGCSCITGPCGERNRGAQGFQLPAEVPHK